MKSNEQKFLKKYPNLKQVINDQHIDFQMYGQVPLQYGENEVYLFDPIGEKKTVLTQFYVDPTKRYALKIEFNQQYIISRLRTKILSTTIVFSIISFVIGIVFIHNIVAWLISVIAIIGIYFILINSYVKELGISAYKVNVIES